MTLPAWVAEVAVLCQPERIHMCDGSEQEYRALCQEMIGQGTFVALNPEKHPGSFWCHSTPGDVARVEEATYICSRTREEAGPTNNWRDPEEMKALLRGLFKGCMRGRTMYVIPFSLGPWDSPASRLGVQITDSPYVVCSMQIMTRMGKGALERLERHPFVPCLHSVGVPRIAGEADTSWPCCNETKYIVHFPEERSIWSFGSGYGGNALLGKKSFALRIASVMGRDEGWLAEHMLILGLTAPSGEKRYFTGAFPSMCGKTNLAMLKSALPGWKVECVGDDIAWLRFGTDGRLWAINPEAGLFGVASGTSPLSNPYLIETVRKNTIFTNVALTADKDVWWEGLTPAPPLGLMSWLGVPWDPTTKEPAAHPNSRFTVSIKQCPIIDSAWEEPQGVPISGILFGSRRSQLTPLVYESFNWPHGVFVGASISSETTAAAAGKRGELRHDPFAMLPFCGYHMGDYFAHWLQMGSRSDAAKLPRIFHVNWFRKDAAGNWLWPGFGENVRVLKWIFERCSGTGDAISSPIGYLPAPGALDFSNLSRGPLVQKELFAIERQGWLDECAELHRYFALFGSRLPQAILQQLQEQEARLVSEHYPHLCTRRSGR